MKRDLQQQVAASADARVFGVESADHLANRGFEAGLVAKLVLDHLAGALQGERIAGVEAINELLELRIWRLQERN